MDGKEGTVNGENEHPFTFDVVSLLKFHLDTKVWKTIVMGKGNGHRLSQFKQKDNYVYLTWSFFTIWLDSIKYQKIQAQVYDYKDFLLQSKLTKSPKN